MTRQQLRLPGYEGPARIEERDRPARQTDGNLTVVRTFTCTLVSSAAKPCLDALPIPAVTNEMGHFPEVLRQLEESYGKTNLLRLVSADSGS